MLRLALSLALIIFLTLLSSPSPGDEAKELNLSQLKEMLSANQGKVVMLEFWAAY